MPFAIETKHLSRRFGAHYAVQNVNLNAPEGAVYALLGRNGAGKTTTLKMLLGLLVPSAGTAYIAGFDIRRQRQEAARRIGVVLEASGFYPHLTGAENLALSSRLAGFDLREVTRALADVDLAEAANKKVSAYSLGMRQRLGVARALLGSPNVLIMDEPTNGLDPDGLAEMREFLRTLPQQRNVSILLSSHLLSEVEKIATHIGILHDGCIAVEGDLAALKAAQAQDIIFSTNDTACTEKIIAAAGLHTQRNEEGVLALFKPTDDMRASISAINRALVEADVAVYSIRPRTTSLEALYNSVLAGSADQPNLEAA